MCQRNGLPGRHGSIIDLSEKRTEVKIKYVYVREGAEGARPRVNMKCGQTDQ